MPKEAKKATKKLSRKGSEVTEDHELPQQPDAPAAATKSTQDDPKNERIDGSSQSNEKPQRTGSDKGERAKQEELKHSDSDESIWMKFQCLLLLCKKKENVFG